MVQESVTIEFFASGYCVSHRRAVNPKEGRGKGRFYAVWALIHTPGIGYVMFDTGYNSLFSASTQNWPEWLYGKITPVTCEQEETAVEILKRKGISAHEICAVIISHFHADHICALRDFPNATLYCSEAALKQVTESNGFVAVRKGIIKKLLPENFYSRIVQIAIKDGEKHASGLIFFPFVGNSQLQLVYLPGHAAGMLGFLFFGKEQTIFFATDAAWDKEVFMRNILPSRIVKLLFDSWKDFVETNNAIKNYMMLAPETKLLFTHCPLTLNETNKIHV